VPANDAEARFSLSTDLGDGPEEASAYADELEKLRDRIKGSSDALREMGSAQRALRGKTADVLAAKKMLVAKIEAERDKVSRANLQLLKHGVTYERLAQKQKKASQVAKAAADELRERQQLANMALAAAGGPVKGWSDGLEKARSIIGGGQGMTYLLAGLTAGVVALGVGFIAAAAALARWAVGAADADRNIRIMDEAVAGSVANGKNLGDQIDRISRKLPISRQAAHDLGDELARTLNNTTYTGQGILDAFAAIGTADAAMGSKVSNTFREMIDRAKMWGRAGTNAFELQGTGVKIQKLAANLAAQTKVPIQEAMAALYENRVESNAFAKALKATLEERYGDINAKKLLSVDVQLQKFSDHLKQLAGGAILEPLLRALDKILSQFDEGTASGAALKAIFTEFGTRLANIDATKLVADIKDILHGVQKAAIEVKHLLDLWNDFRAHPVETVGKEVIEGATGGALPKVGTPDFAPKAALGAAGIGAQISQGLATGIAGAASKYAVTKATETLAGWIKDAFSGKKGIDAHSPSRWFEQKGEESTEGYVRGVKKDGGGAQDAVEDMVPQVPARAPVAVQAAAGGGGRGSSEVVEVHVIVHATSETKGQEIAAAITEPSILAQLTRAVRNVAQAGGIPTSSPVPT
jgi:hypothetical protein